MDGIPTLTTDNNQTQTAIPETFNATQETEQQIQDIVAEDNKPVQDDFSENTQFVPSMQEEPKQEQQTDFINDITDYQQKEQQAIDEPTIDNYYGAPVTQSFAENLDVSEQKTSLAIYNEENGTNLTYQEPSETQKKQLNMIKDAIKAYGWFTGVDGETEQEKLTKSLISLANIDETLPATLKDIGLSAATGVAKTAKDISDVFLPESMEYPEPDYKATTPVGRFADPTMHLISAAASVKAVGSKAVLPALKPFVKSAEGLKWVKGTTELLEDFLAMGTAMWRDESNLSTVVKNLKIPYVSDVASFLAIDKDDSDAEKFFKQGTEAVFLGAPKVMDYVKDTLSLLRTSKKTYDSVQRVTNLNKTLIKPTEIAAEEIDDGAKFFSDYAKNYDIDLPEKRTVVIPRTEKEVELNTAYKSAEKTITDSGYYNIETAEQRLQAAKNLVAKQKGIVKKTAVAGNVLDAEWRDVQNRFAESVKLYNDKSITKEQLDDIFWDGIERIETFDGFFKDVAAPAGQSLQIASQSEANLYINRLKKQLETEEATPLKTAIMDSGSGRDVAIKWKWAKKLLGTDTVKNVYKKLILLTQNNLLSPISTQVKNITGNTIEMGKKIVINPFATTVGWARRALNLGDVTDYVTMEDSAQYAGKAISSTINGFAQILPNFSKKESKRILGRKETGHIYNTLMGIKKDTPEDLFETQMLKMYAKYGPLKWATVEDMPFAAAQYKASLQEGLSRLMRKSGLEKMDQKEAAKFIYNKILTPDSGNEISGLMRPIKEKYITQSAKRYAAAEAKYQVFKGGYSGATNALSKIMNFPVLKLFYTPFFQTKATMLIDHVVRDDLGSMVGKGWLYGKKTAKWGAESDKAFAKGAMLTFGGLPLLFGSFGLATTGKITGGKYSNKQKEQQFIQSGGQHNSFVFTDYNGRRSYVSIPDSSAGDILKIGAAVAQAWDEFSDRENAGKVFEDPDVIDKFMEAARATGAYALDELTLRALGETFSASNIEENSEKAKQKLVNAFANATVPRALQTVGADTRFKRDYARDLYEMISNKINWLDGGTPRWALSNTGELIQNDNSLLFMTTGMHYKEETPVEKIKREGGIVFPRINSVKLNSDLQAPISKEENYRLREIMRSNGADQHINQIILGLKDVIKTDQAKQTIMGIFNDEVKIATQQLLKENPDISRRAIRLEEQKLEQQYE